MITTQYVLLLLHLCGTGNNMAKNLHKHNNVKIEVNGKPMYLVILVIALWATFLGCLVTDSDLAAFCMFWVAVGGTDRLMNKEDE